MSDFSSYEENLLALFQRARDELASANNSNSNSDNNDINNNNNNNNNNETAENKNKLEAVFAEIRDCVEIMDTEVKTQPTSSRKALQEKMIAHKTTLRKLEAEAARGAKGKGDKAALMGGKSDEQRQKVQSLQDR